MLTLSKSKGIGGKIKQSPEDFVVEEITKNGTVLKLDKTYTADDIGAETLQSGKFSEFVLQKKDWNTAQALRSIAKNFRRGIKSTAFAGTKDRTAISTQLCSIFGVGPEQLNTVRIKDIQINGAWYSNSKVEMGDLLGNRFYVTVRQPNAAAEQKANDIIEELNGRFPNYFGEQRFGSRGNNVEIGISMLKGDYEGAAMRFLTDTTNEINQSATEARKRLAGEQDFTQALQYFPGYLKYERTMLEYLSKYPSNYANAIRKLPRSLSLMFVHSVEAQIFNRELELRIDNDQTISMEDDITCGVDASGFPDLSSAQKHASEAKLIVANIVGYDTKPNQVEDQVLKELEINTEMFKLPKMPELNCKGTLRVLFAPYIGMEVLQDNDQNLRFGFSLSSGCYATVLLSEFLK